MSRNLVLVPFALILLAALAACGGSQGTPTPEPTSQSIPEATSTSPPATPTEIPLTAVGELTGAETRYLDTLEAAVRRMDQVVSSVGTALDQTWPTRERLIDVLSEARIGDARASMLEELDQLDPPDRFQEDHHRYMAFLREQVPLTQEHDQRASQGDLAEVVVYRARLLAARSVFFGTLASADFCNAINSSLHPPVRNAPSAWRGIRG